MKWHEIETEWQMAQAHRLAIISFHKQQKANKPPSIHCKLCKWKKIDEQDWRMEMGRIKGQFILFVPAWF